MPVVCIRAVLVAVLLPCGLGIQGRTSRRSQKVSQSSKDAAQLQPKYLDEAEVEERGSHCLDGSVPVFHHKEGTGSSTSKWVFWFGTNGICTNSTNCASYDLKKSEVALDSRPLQAYGEFADYHHVQFANCDQGYYLGDLDTPLSVDGSELYLQGGRIITHVIETLASNYSMTDVLVAGGSGGGLSVYNGAYHIKSLMPDTVERFGVVPINGWFAENTDDELAAYYSLAHVADNMAPACKDDNVNGSDCLHPVVNYNYGADELNMFVVQVYDYTFQIDNEEVYEDWIDCMSQTADADDMPREASGECTDEKAANVAKYWSDFVSAFAGYPRYTKNGHGGFFSTCAEHTFYNDDDRFSTLMIQGVSVGEAVWTWWESLAGNGDQQSHWYLPCDMGSTADSLQCDSTCKSESEY